MPCRTQTARMIPGPDLILACPHCGALSRLFTLTSSDAGGAISWTDGYQHFPLAPRQPNVLRCHACAQLHWLAECKEVGMIDPIGMEPVEGAPRFASFEKAEQPEPGTLPPDGWVTAPQMQPLDEAGYFAALSGGLAKTPEQEIELRVHAWWLGNDRFRNIEGEQRHPASSEAIENLDRIIVMTEGGDHEFVLFRAEALRQLGRFAEAEEALYGLCSDYALAREKLTELIRAKSRDLTVLFA